MGGGGGGSEQSAEPNLTALLDLVMQLLMFFLIVANFVMEQNNQDIKLPEATTAVPIEKADKDILQINVDQAGNLVLADTEQGRLSSEVQIARYMQDQYAGFKRERGEKELKEMAVVVRGDNRANFEHIYRIMRAAKDAGFTNVLLRANRQTPAGGQ